MCFPSVSFSLNCHFLRLIFSFLSFLYLIFLSLPFSFSNFVSPSLFLRQSLFTVFSPAIAPFSSPALPLFFYPLPHSPSSLYVFPPLFLYSSIPHSSSIHLSSSLPLLVFSLSSSSPSLPLFDFPPLFLSSSFPLSSSLCLSLPLPLFVFPPLFLYLSSLLSSSIRLSPSLPLFVYSPLFLYSSFPLSSSIHLP